MQCMYAMYANNIKYLSTVRTASYITYIKRNIDIGEKSLFVMIFFSQ